MATLGDMATMPRDPSWAPDWSPPAGKDTAPLAGGRAADAVLQLADGTTVFLRGFRHA